ncbi:hypothetical protein R69746_08146 [Paraburkholderia aspalathi]|uniref:hypothetical protein n=1 Tax=Paraburkholderia aspalathi TaxID=1324617 RepID=UPI001B0D0B3D|nr:hypothetical protein [Paraburkholderia aspalathi]CAE6866789.1 hypothetical protein R69746_08146 [Paraburkholderia aspalathi]
MSNDIAAQIKSLKLHDMASSWPEPLAQSRHTEFEPERFMKQWHSQIDERRLIF